VRVAQLDELDTAQMQPLAVVTEMLAKPPEAGTVSDAGEKA
jgi:hypothetical protein